MQEKFKTPWYVVRDTKKGFKVARDFGSVPGCFASPRRWKRWLKKNSITKWLETEEEARLIVAALPMYEALQAVQQHLVANADSLDDAAVKKQVDEAIVAAERRRFRD
jgi:hypothetical protein